MRIMVLGGDGFCGWPTSLHLAAHGHNVLIVDNLSRRRIDLELGTDSLTPIAPIDVRLAAWQQEGGEPIGFRRIDVARQFERLCILIESFRPNAIVHFAEQRAAPYSMKDADTKRYTVDNNVNATHNTLAAILSVDPSIHLVHLGTMGTYGYGTAPGKIPEGYLQVEINGQSAEIPHPYYPGSIYHSTKCLDQILFHFYAKNDKLAITDLAQGVVWGTETEETAQNELLVNRFDYDGDYGTVLNRFLMQAAVGYPLTVYGTGGQTRAFIHIQNTVECIRLALESPPERGERVRILNQMTECHRVEDLAKIVASLFNAEIQYVENPRNEAAENELAVANDSLLGMGLEPKTLGKDLMTEVTKVVWKYEDRANVSKIPCTSKWRQ